MQVLVDGIALHPSEVILREGLFDYTATLQFTLPYTAIFKACTLKLASEFPFVPVSIKQVSSTTFQYLCYPKGYIDFLQAPTPTINVTGELPALLDAVAGCRYAVLSPTQPQHWVLASMGGKTLLDTLSQQVRFVNGGCPTAHFDVAGTLLCQDVLQRCSEAPTAPIAGTLQESLSATTFQNQVQGKIRYHFFDDATYTLQEDTYLEKAGVANMYKFVVADDRKVQVTTALQAQFWRRYVSTSLTTYTDLITTVLQPGQKVLFMGTEQAYLCISVHTVSSTQGAKITGTFIPSIAPQQTLG